MFNIFGRSEPRMPTPETALPGRQHPIPTAETHFISGRPLGAEVPEGMEEAMFSMGCFWGVERQFWQMPGVWLTMVGYAGGYTPNPTYQEICTGQTGHAEVVRLIFDPSVIGYAALLRQFWEGHDPTQHMRQGNDVGTQYRSVIFTYSDAQRAAAEATRAAFAPLLEKAGFGPVMTAILPAPVFYFAEDYHQQYLAKNPQGYCGVGGTGVCLPPDMAHIPAG